MNTSSPAVERHDVVIVGGGPAGLAAAGELKRLGVRDVVVLEREQHAGGVPRHCGHIGFGWREFRRLLSGPAYARRLLAATGGIDIRTGTTALGLEANARVRALTSEDMRIFEGRYVMLALGTRETPRAARLVSGTRPWGVFTTGALQQMVYLAGLKPCTRAVIVGSELVSFSSLLTLRHAGIRAPAMLEEAARITAPRAAAWVARGMFGTRILTDAKLIAIHGERQVSGVEIERNGSRSRIDCDGVIFSGQFVPEAAILRAGHLSIDPATGGPIVDQFGRCSDPAFFAAGNLLRPVEASWTVWQEGRNVARAIAASLSGRLPAATHFVTLDTLAPVRYVCPQKYAFPAPIAPALPLNIRVHRAVHGRLRVMHGANEVWSESRHLGPERRVIVSFVVPEIDAATPLTIGFEESLPD